MARDISQSSLNPPLPLKAATSRARSKGVDRAAASPTSGAMARRAASSATAW
jgi:hypothetical protein